MTAMAIQHIGRVRAAIEAQEITKRTGIPLAEITYEDRWEYAMGSMDEGASEHWPRWPYRFPWPPAETDWPRPAPLPEWPAEPFDLITQGEEQ